MAIHIEKPTLLLVKCIVPLPCFYYISNELVFLGKVVRSLRVGRGIPAGLWGASPNDVGLSNDVGDYPRPLYEYYSTAGTVDLLGDCSIFYRERRCPCG